MVSSQCGVVGIAGGQCDVVSGQFGVVGGQCGVVSGQCGVVSLGWSVWGGRCSGGVEDGQ